MNRLAHGELGVRMHDRSAAFRLRQHDGVRIAANHHIEIIVGQAGRKAVDANEQARAHARRHRFPQEGEGGLARFRLAVGRNRVLEVDDQRIGAARHALGELLGAVARYKQKGTQGIRPAA